MCPNPYEFNSWASTSNHLYALKYSQWKQTDIHQTYRIMSFLSLNVYDFVHYIFRVIHITCIRLHSIISEYIISCHNLSIFYWNVIGCCIQLQILYLSWSEFSGVNNCIIYLSIHSECQSFKMSFIYLYYTDVHLHQLIRAWDEKSNNIPNALAQ